MAEITPHHRRSIRLQGFDYSHAGLYFVTICAHEKQCLFGGVSNGEMHLNPAGKMLLRWAGEVPHKFPGVTFGDFLAMPNHVHTIVRFDEPAPEQPLAWSLGQVIGWFKTMTTNEYIRHARQSAWTRFDEHFWQRNYHEHVIRNDEELENIRRYIRNNPFNWQIDVENPTFRGLRNPQRPWEPLELRAAT